MSSTATIPTPRSSSRLRLAALRIVSVTCAAFSALCMLAVIVIPIETYWPSDVVTVYIGPGSVVAWRLLALLALYGYGCGRTSWLLWHRRRSGALLAAFLFASGVLANYYGPMKGMQAVGLSVAMLALLGVGWRELR